MKIFMVAGFFALVLGGYFYDDLEYYWENEVGSKQANSSSGDLGGAVRNNFGYVGGSLGH